MPSNCPRTGRPVATPSGDPATPPDYATACHRRSPDSRDQISRRLRDRVRLETCDQRSASTDDCQVRVRWAFTPRTRRPPSRRQDCAGTPCRGRRARAAHAVSVRLLWPWRACARFLAARHAPLRPRWARSQIAPAQGLRQSTHSMPNRRSRAATRSSLAHPRCPWNGRYRARSTRRRSRRDVRLRGDPRQRSERPLNDRLADAQLSTYGPCSPRKGGECPVLSYIPVAVAEQVSAAARRHCRFTPEAVTPTPWLLRRRSGSWTRRRRVGVVPRRRSRQIGSGRRRWLRLARASGRPEWRAVCLAGQRLKVICLVVAVVV